MTESFSDWLNKDEASGHVVRTVRYNTGEGIESWDFKIHILNGTVIDQIEGSMFEENEDHVMVRRKGNNIMARSVEMVRQSLKLSHDEMATFRRMKPLNLLEQLAAVCETINGHGEPEDIAAAKKEDGADGSTSDSES